jgi:hypothetical protein
VYTYIAREHRRDAAAPQDEHATPQPVPGPAE